MNPRKRSIVGAGQAKIFGIGLSKTGTSSLAQALQRLGFTTKDCMGATRYVAGDLSSIDMDTVLAHDALTDTPIPSFYRELDRRFPGSKFILTVRDREGWLRSCKKQFNERSAAAQNDAHRRLFEDLYGTNVFDEQRFAGGYERFVAGVMEYFRNRPQDLLVLNVAAGEGWEKLCPFVGRPVPDMPFPKANVTQIRWMNIDDLVAVAEAAGRELLKRYGGAVETAGRETGAVRAAGGMSILERALQAALGRDAVEAAMRSAHRVIVTRLGRLNPAIPVLSPVEAAPAFAQRRQWNHVWLIDPLDGRRAFAGGRREFSVNVALVEDGQPIYGVVHAPALGTTYYGRIGKGAYRRAGAGAAVRLAAPSGEPATTAAPGAGAGRDDQCSLALAMCALLERPPQHAPAFGPAAEWKAAAAQAVLSAAELRALDEGSGNEPTYNSQRLEVAPLTFRSKEPA
jgi:3'-phosphoadenosine 5'-phosphosulfate (PAPS) 3'-phosphatase